MLKRHDHDSYIKRGCGRRSASRKGSSGTPLPPRRRWQRLHFAALLVALLCMQPQQAAAQLTAVTEAAQVSSVAPLTASAANNVMLRFYVNSADPLAVCNDGTPGAAALHAGWI